MRRITFIIIIFVLCNSINIAQNKEFPDIYCANKTGQKISDSAIKDSIYISYVEANDTLFVEVNNTTNNTIYLFSSYYYDLYYSSKYLHQLDTINKIYTIAFLPIIPFLGVTASDVVNLNKDRLTKPFQVLYDFIILRPNTKHVLNISVKTLFNNLNDDIAFIERIKYYNLSKFDRKIDFSFLQTKLLKKEYDFFIELAYYDNISLLCTKDAFYYNESAFNKQALSFNIIKQQINIRNLEHPLIK